MLRYRILIWNIKIRCGSLIQKKSGFCDQNAIDFICTYAILNMILLMIYLLYMFSIYKWIQRKFHFSFWRSWEKDQKIKKITTNEWTVYLNKMVVILICFSLFQKKTLKYMFSNQNTQTSEAFTSYYQLEPQ